MTEKPKPPPAPLPEPDDELPPEQIQERMRRALQRAFTLPYKPHQPRGDKPKRSKP